MALIFTYLALDINSRPLEPFLRGRLFTLNASGSTQYLDGPRASAHSADTPVIFQCSKVLMGG